MAMPIDGGVMYYGRPAGSRFVQLTCQRCQAWTWHQYPRAPKTYWPIRCLKCGDGYGIQDENTYTKTEKGGTTYHRVATQFWGTLRVE